MKHQALWCNRFGVAESLSISARAVNLGSLEDRSVADVGTIKVWSSKRCAEGETSNFACQEIFCLNVPIMLLGVLPRFQVTRDTEWLRPYLYSIRQSIHCVQ